MLNSQEIPLISEGCLRYSRTLHILGTCLRYSRTSLIEEIRTSPHPRKPVQDIQELSRVYGMRSFVTAFTKIPNLSIS